MRGGKLIGLTVSYGTPEPKRAGWYRAMYRVRWLGRWELDGGGAGNDRDPVGMVEVTICRA